MGVVFKITYHFDSNFELEAALRTAGKNSKADMIRNILPDGIQCIFVRQSEQLGLGHAILCAERAVGNTPFAVLLADDFLTDNKKPLIEFSIMNNLKGSSIDCFSNPSGQWGIQELVNIKKNRVQIKLKDEYLSGRARLNCTTKVDDKWYWFGYQFLVK